MHKFNSYLYSLIAFVLKVIMFKKITLDIWSIKVFQSNSFLSRPIEKGITDNPTIQAKEVTDINAEFVADPFIISDRDKFYMFFEVLDKASRKGIIGLATSVDGEKWDYDRIVLKEKFHLSYPYLFKNNGNFYMIPESCESRGVFLYKAQNFPYEWKIERKLIDGEYVDSSIFFYNKKWWLFAGQTGKLLLFYSDKLNGNWTEHPNSPLITENYNITRPGGRVIVYEGNVYRYTQDCQPYYGSGVRIFKIGKLSEWEYEEEEQDLILSGTQNEIDWNKDGMHSIDQLKLTNGKWLIAVDGHRREKRNYLFWKLEHILSKIKKIGLLGLITISSQMELEQFNIGTLSLDILLNMT